MIPLLVPAPAPWTITGPPLNFRNDTHGQSEFIYWQR